MLAISISACDPGARDRPVHEHRERVPSHRLTPSTSDATRGRPLDSRWLRLAVVVVALAGCSRSSPRAAARRTRSGSPRSRRSRPPSGRSTSTRPARRSGCCARGSTRGPTGSCRCRSRAAATTLNAQRVQGARPRADRRQHRQGRPMSRCSASRPPARGAPSRTAVSAASTWSAVASVAFGPIRPTRQIGGVAAPSPPPTSRPCSASSCRCTSLPSMPSGTRSAVSGASLCPASASTSRPASSARAAKRRPASLVARASAPRPPRPASGAGPRGGRRRAGSERCGGRRPAARSSRRAAAAGRARTAPASCASRSARARAARRRSATCRAARPGTSACTSRRSRSPHASKSSARRRAS